MDDALSIYLHDHLMGSRFAIDLLETLERDYLQHQIGPFAHDLVVEVREDQKTLEEIIAHVGDSHMIVSDVAGWLGEKVSKLKLQSGKSDCGLETFESLETLSLGIRGKLALWRALAVIRQFDPRVPGLDFGRLAERAEAQFARAEKQRLELAGSTFLPIAP